MHDTMALRRRVNFFASLVLGLVLAVIVGFFIASVKAFADDGGTVADGDWIKQAFQLATSWKQLGLYGGLAMLVKLLVDATKTNLLGGVFHKLPDGTQLLLVMALGALAVGLPIMASGGGLLNAVIAVVNSSAGAMLLNEFLKRVMGIGASSPAAPAAPAAPTQ